MERAQRVNILVNIWEAFWALYIAGALSDNISHFHALKATLIMKRGIVLDRWARGLSVMLEKMFGCALITKL